MYAWDAFATVVTALILNCDLHNYRLIPSPNGLEGGVVKCSPLSIISYVGNM